MLTVAFLRHVLAHTGWICIDIKQEKTKGFKHRFFQSFEQAAAYAQKQDQLGHTVYFACGTFKEPANRRQVNVAYLKSFWGDCDVGPGKPYASRKEAEDALIAFLAATGLPPPFVVSSGLYGLHLYWVLEEPLTPDEWRPRAEAFRELCKRHGFHLDPTRTADQSSVLRPPGTHNRKLGSAHPVTVAYAPPPSALEALAFGGSGQQPDVKVYVGKPRKQTLLEGASVYGEMPSDAHKMAAECAQIANLRDTQGNLSYNLWLFCIWTLHFTTQGDAIAHEYSAGHPNYTYEETQRKLDEATSPITCARFNEYNDLCRSCMHWGKISTPLQLGRETILPAAVPLPEPPVHMNGVSIAGSYLNDEHGLRFITEDKKKGNQFEIKISRWPIYVTSVCRGEREQDFSLILTMKTPHMDDLSIPIPAGVFFSAQGMSELHRQGAVIHEHDLLRKYVREQMDAYNTSNAPQSRYSQFGWKDHGNAFLFGNKLYTQSQIITTVGAPEIERRARMLGPRGGSLQAWSAAANKLFAIGCEPHSFALCCAFGAPLMRFLSEEEGGAILNIVSETSATGKTTGLEAVASVWGELDGIRLLDEDTQISRGIFLGTLGNLPCVFDELHNRDPDSIRQFVTIFTNGRDKLRAKADGTIRDPAGDWQTILILGSNVSLIDILQTKSREEAQAFRILELIAEQNFSGNDGDKLRRELKENRGWAGEAYIQYLMKPGVLEHVRDALDGIVAALWDPEYHFDKRHRFWVRMIACAFIGGKIASELGIIDCNPKRIIQWVADRCQERRDNEGRRDNAQLLNEALYDIWASTLVVDKEFKPKTSCFVLVHPSQNKVFVARRVRESGRMYVMRSWLRSWMVKHGINRTGFFKDLKERRVIITDNKFVTLGAGTDYSSGGQVVCYEIDMQHPDMAGALEVSERDVRERHPLDDVHLPERAAPSPPSTLQ